MPRKLPAVVPVDTTPHLRHAASLLRRRRVAHEPLLTQAHVAAQIGVSRDILGQFERAEAWLHPDALLRLATLLRVPFTHLLPDDPASAEAQLLRLTASELRLLGLLRTLPPDVQAAERLWELLAPMRP